VYIPFFKSLFKDSSSQLWFVLEPPRPTRPSQNTKCVEGKPAHGTYVNLPTPLLRALAVRYLKRKSDQIGGERSLNSSAPRRFSKLQSEWYKVNVFVDGENVRFAQGNATQLTHDSEVRIYPAISGG
jgi:molybdopterin converting factor small subunit